MKLFYLSDWPLNNPQLRSGVPYNIAMGLSNNQTPHKEINLPPQRGRFFAKLKSKSHQIWFNKILKQRKGLWDANFEPFKAKETAQIVNREIDKERPDALFSIKVADFAFLRTNIPRFIWIDNTYDTFISTPHQPAIPKKLYDSIIKTEKKSMQNCTKIFTASYWLKDHIHTKYLIPLEKIEVIRRGASFVGFKNANEFRNNLAKKSTNHCHILFIGTHWLRKGGDKVIATCKLLKEQSFPYTLHVVGSEPDFNAIKELGNNCIYHGRLKQNKKEDAAKLRELFSKSHFLFVPTLAEGFGIVYAEAASFGLPSLATDVMGVESAVVNDITGYRFPLNTSDKVYADYIKKLFNNKISYDELSKKTFDFAIENFVWEKNVNHLIISMMQSIRND